MSVMIAAGVLAVVAGLAVPSTGPAFVMAVLIGVVSALCLGYLALQRFEWFIWVVLLVRPVLDLTKGERGASIGSTSGALAAVLGGAVIVFGVVWMAGLARDGSRLPFGFVSRVLLLLMVTSGVSILNSAEPLTSALQVARTLGAVVLFVVLEQLLRSRRVALRGLHVCALAALIPLAVGLFQLVIGGGAKSGRITGTFLHPNSFGFFLVVVIVMGYALRPYVQNRRHKLFLSGLLLVSGAELVFTYSRGSWIVLLVGALLLGLLADRRIFLALPVMVGVGIVAFPTIAERLSDLTNSDTVGGRPGNSATWRLAHLQEIISGSNGGSLFGIGPKMTDLLTEGGRPPHNDAVRLLVENGVVGLVLYVAFLIGLVLLAIRALRRLRSGFGRGLAVGYATTVLVFVLDSMGANLITQFVLLIYILTLTAIVQAWVALADDPSTDNSAEAQPATPRDA